MVEQWQCVLFIMQVFAWPVAMAAIAARWSVISK
jgi:hypothetical protein